MAIDYGNYVQLYGAGVDLSPLQQGIQDMKANRKEKVIGEVNQATNEIWGEVMKPYESAVYGNIGDMGTLGLGTKTAGDAFLRYKQKLMSMGQRHYDEAGKLGLLDPVSFKQQFDQMKSSYMPMIEKKIETHFNMENLSDDEKRDFISKNNLNAFLLMNADDAGIIKDLANPERSWEQWRKQQGGGLGLTMSGTGLAGGAYAGYGMGQRMLSEYSAGANKFTKRQNKIIEKALKELPTKKVGQGVSARNRRDFGLKARLASENKIVQGVSNAKAERTRAQTAIDKAKKKWKKGGNKAKDFNKNHKSLIDRHSKADDALKKARSKKPLKFRDQFNKAIKKHGKRKVARMVLKKMGWKAGAGMLAKLGLMSLPTGVTQAAGGAMLAADVYMIYNILKDLNE
jgi:hypothetical protein